jgi:polyisoprenoid-binding protein YceI
LSTTSLGLLPSTAIWNIDSRHSTARFSVRHHAVASFRAGFAPVSGSYDAEAGTLTGEVRIDAVQVPVEALRNHMQTPDFFDAAQFPTISFRSTSIQADDHDITVEGDLTIKGVTRRVSAAGTHTAPVLVGHPDGVELEHFGIDLSVTIDRRDYDVSFNNALPAGILNLGWDVKIDVALEFIQES